MRKALYILLFICPALLLGYSAGLAYPDLHLNKDDIAFSSDYPAQDDVVYITATIRNSGDSYSEPLIEHAGSFLNWSPVYNSQWLAQSFYYDEDVKITGISLQLADMGTDDSITVNLQTSEVVASTQLPSGISLSTKTINTDNPGFEWVDIIFDNIIELSAGTTYWIVAKNASALNTNGYGWLPDETAGFVNGQGAYSSDQGFSWDESSYDRTFKVYRSTQVQVGFYDGDPDGAGTEIGTKILDPVPGSSYSVIYCTWSTSVVGTHHIYIKIDTDNYLTETSTANNKNSQIIYVDFPFITEAVTMDLNSNGYLDGYHLKFNKSMNPQTLVQSSTAGFAVAGYSGLYISTNSLPATEMYLRFSEKSSPDTGTVPEITYSSATGRLTDTDGNLLLDIVTTGINEKDGAASCISSNGYSPADGTLGVAVDTPVTFNFNEEMDVAATTSAVRIEAVKNNCGASIMPQAVIFSYQQSYDSTTYRHTFTLNPIQNLRNNYSYRVTLATTALDATGNPVSNLTFNFTTIMSPDDTNTYFSADDKFKVELPPGCISSSFYVRMDTGSISAAAETAGEKLNHDSDDFTFPLTDTLVNIHAYDHSGKEITGNFNKPVTVTLSYSDTDSDGYVDNTSPALPEETLRVYCLDKDHSLWVKLPESDVNTESNRVTAESLHFTSFILMGTGNTGLDDAYAFPVPFYPTRDSKITFTNLSPECDIKIYTLSGELVEEISHSGGEQEYWEDINEGSGVYLYIIKNEKDSCKGKLMIIR